jgi:hypothetical protein
MEDFHVEGAATGEGSTVQHKPALRRDPSVGASFGGLDGIIIQN